MFLGLLNPEILTITPARFLYVYCLQNKKLIILYPFMGINDI